jgi:hypothetical protein
VSTTEAQHGGQPPKRRAPEAFADWVNAHKPPLWSRFAIALIIAAVVIIALIRFVDHENPLVAQPSSPSQKQAATEQAQDTIVVQQQQAPHVVAVASKTAPLGAIKSAVHKYMATETGNGQINGSLQHLSCKAAGGTASRAVFHCTAVAASVKYPFDGVVQPAAGKVTYCQVVLPPIPSMKVPVSTRCT